MPGGSLDRERRIFTCTQSLLSDLQRCPERAWYTLNFPSHGYNDATAMGTAMHLFAEERLKGTYLQECIDGASSWLIEATQRDDFEWVKVKTLDTLLKHLLACIRGMDRHVMPQVPEGGYIERRMRAQLCHSGDWTVILEGTPDYVDPFGRIWDWKSAGSEYNGWEAANWHVQPTAYTFLASQVLEEKYHDFTYAVAVKPHGDIQLIDVERGERDWAWLGRVARGMLNLCLQLPNGGWPVNHTHYLCAPAWCPHWDGCRGAVEPQAVGVDSLANNNEQE